MDDSRWGRRVQLAEAFLTINLKTAQAMGLNVPDDILRQASTVIR